MINVDTFRINLLIAISIFEHPIYMNAISETYQRIYHKYIPLVNDSQSANIDYLF